MKSDKTLGAGLYARLTMLFYTFLQHESISKVIARRLQGLLYRYFGFLQCRCKQRSYTKEHFEARLNLKAFAVYFPIDTI